MTKTMGGGLLGVLYLVCSLHVVQGFGAAVVDRGEYVHRSEVEKLKEQLSHMHDLMAQAQDAIVRLQVSQDGKSSVFLQEQEEDTSSLSNQSRDMIRAKTRFIPLIFAALAVAGGIYKIYQFAKGHFESYDAVEEMKENLKEASADANCQASLSFFKAVLGLQLQSKMMKYAARAVQVTDIESCTQAVKAACVAEDGASGPQSHSDPMLAEVASFNIGDKSMCSTTSSIDGSPLVDTEPMREGELNGAAAFCRSLKEQMADMEHAIIETISVVESATISTCDAWRDMAIRKIQRDLEMEDFFEKESYSSVRKAFSRKDEDYEFKKSLFEELADLKESPAREMLNNMKLDAMNSLDVVIPSLKAMSLEEKGWEQAESSSLVKQLRYSQIQDVQVAGGDVPGDVATLFQEQFTDVGGSFAYGGALGISGSKNLVEGDWSVDPLNPDEDASGLGPYIGIFLICSNLIMSIVAAKDARLLQDRRARAYNDAINSRCEHLKMLSIQAGQMQVMLLNNEMTIMSLLEYADERAKKAGKKKKDLMKADEAFMYYFRSILYKFKGDEVFMKGFNRNYCAGHLHLDAEDTIGKYASCKLAVQFAMLYMDPTMDPLDVNEALHHEDKESFLPLIKGILRMTKKKMQDTAANLDKLMNDIGCDPIDYIMQSRFERQEAFMSFFPDSSGSDVMDHKKALAERERERHGIDSHGVVPEYQFSILLQSVSNVPSTSSMETPDPYFKIHLEGDVNPINMKRSQVFTDNVNPIFNDVYTFENVEDSDDKDLKLVFELYDHNTIEKDLHIGKVKVPVRSLVSNYMSKAHTARLAKEPSIDKDAEEAALAETSRGKISRTQAFRLNPSDIVTDGIDDVTFLSLAAAARQEKMRELAENFDFDGVEVSYNAKLDVHDPHRFVSYQSLNTILKFKLLHVSNIRDPPPPHCQINDLLMCTAAIEALMCDIPDDFAARHLRESYSDYLKKNAQGMVKDGIGNVDGNEETPLLQMLSDRKAAQFLHTAQAIRSRIPVTEKSYSDNRVEDAKDELIDYGYRARSLSPKPAGLDMDVYRGRILPFARACADYMSATKPQTDADNVASGGCLFQCMNKPREEKMHECLDHYGQKEKVYVAGKECTSDTGELDCTMPTCTAKAQLMCTATPSVCRGDPVFMTNSKLTPRDTSLDCLNPHMAAEHFVGLEEEITQGSTKWFFDMFYTRLRCENKRQKTLGVRSDDSMASTEKKLKFERLKSSSVTVSEFKSDVFYHKPFNKADDKLMTTASVLTVNDGGQGQRLFKAMVVPIRSDSNVGQPSNTELWSLFKENTNRCGTKNSPCYEMRSHWCNAQCGLMSTKGEFRTRLTQSKYDNCQGLCDQALSSVEPQDYANNPFSSKFGKKMCDITGIRRETSWIKSGAAREECIATLPKFLPAGLKADFNSATDREVINADLRVAVGMDVKQLIVIRVYRKAGKNDVVAWKPAEAGDASEGAYHLGSSPDSMVTVGVAFIYATDWSGNAGEDAVKPDFHEICDKKSKTCLTFVWDVRDLLVYAVDGPEDYKAKKSAFLAAHKVPGVMLKNDFLDSVNNLDLRDQAQLLGTVDLNVVVKRPRKVDAVGVTPEASPTSISSAEPEKIVEGKGQEEDHGEDNDSDEMVTLAGPEEIRDMLLQTLPIESADVKKSE